MSRALAELVEEGRIVPSGQRRWPLPRGRRPDRHNARELPGERPHFAARDAFVAKLSGGAGGHLWSHLMGGSGLDIGYAVTTLADGTVVVAGEFELSATFGTDTHAAMGGADIFVSTYSASGTFQSSTSHGGPARDRCLWIDRSGGDGYVLSGYIEDAADLGGPPTGFQGTQDAFVASYLRDGSFSWQQTGGSSEADTGDAVVRAGSQLWWIVSLAGLIAVDGAELRSRCARDLGAFALVH